MGRIGFECSTCGFPKALVGFLIILTPFVAMAEELVDRLVAEVNGNPITYSEVQEKIKKKVLVEVSAHPASDKDGPYHIALQDSINLQLIMQRAEELGIDVSDEALETEISNFIKRRNLTRDALQRALAQEGMTYEQYKKDWRKQMLVSQFQGREILPSVKITAKDLEIYYLQETGASGESIKLTLRQLYIRLPKDAPESVLKGKREVVGRAHQELKGGLDFKKAVKIYSDSESGRENGGLMPSMLLKDLAPAFRKAVAQLEEKQFSDPVEAGPGVYFFFLEKKEFAGSDEFEKLKPQLEQKLRQEQIASQTIRWIDDQRRRSEIRVID